MTQSNPYSFTPTDDQGGGAGPRRPFPFDFVVLVVCCVFIPALIPARVTGADQMLINTEAAMIWLPVAAICAGLVFSIVRNRKRHWFIRVAAGVLMVLLAGFLYGPVKELL